MMTSSADPDFDNISLPETVTGGNSACGNRPSSRISTSHHKKRK
tara:strand:+ start:112 stop:243 length:132 start_codon:yes stop_codon:yes gene_type:complete